MALEKPFIEGHVFYSHDVLITDLNDLVYQQEWKAVGELALYILKIIDGRFTWIITREGGNIPVLSDILFYFLQIQHCCYARVG